MYSHIINNYPTMLLNSVEFFILTGFDLFVYNSSSDLSL